MNNHFPMTPVTAVLAGTLVWGLIWYPFRILEQLQVPGPLAIMLTDLLAIVFAAFMLPQVWRERHQLDRWAVLLALCIGWTNLAYVLAVLEGEIIRVLLLFYLAPLWTVILSYFLLGEKLNWHGATIIALSLAGAFIMLYNPDLGIPLPANSAEWLGLSAGLCFAASNVISRRASHLSIETKSISVFAGTAALTIPFLLWQGNLVQNIAQINYSAWLLLAILGLTLCAVSYAVQYGVTHMPANRAGMLFLIELIVGAVSAWLLAGETIHLQEWIGAGLIISASLLSNKLGHPEKQPSGD